MSAQATAPARLGEHAIVIGGSIAGLVAARVLADHFDRVTIVERDRFPAEPEPRKGVPQGRHLHVLLTRGHEILEQLFPGLDADLAAAGAPRVDLTRDFEWFSPVGWGIRFTSGIETRACSRVLLEWLLHRRMAARPAIRILQGCSVTGLLPTAAGTGVAGLRYVQRGSGDEATAGETELRADLVVDTSGRNSRAAAWLQALGYPAAEETVVNSFLGYATRVYARPAGFAGDWQGVIVQSTAPTVLRGGTIFPAEGDRWFVILTGMGRDYPPIDEAGFLAFAKSLRDPIIYDSIQDAQPLSAITGYRATENRFRHYERLARAPERFIVLGDAACAFNPVYGQGMTAAALAGLTLARALQAHGRRHPAGDLTGLARACQRQLARASATIWVLATGEDFRCPATEGGRPGPAVRLMHRYVDRVLRRAAHDARARIALIQVLHLLRPAGVLFHPAVLLPALGPSRPPVAPVPAPREVGSV